MSDGAGPNRTGEPGPGGVPCGMPSWLSRLLRILGWSFPLFRLGGIQLAMHWSFLLLPAYAAVAAKFQTSGQDCLAANRILVHESIHDEFVARFTERMAALTVGNGLHGEAAAAALSGAILQMFNHGLSAAALFLAWRDTTLLPAAIDAALLVTLLVAAWRTRANRPQARRGRRR